MGWQDAGVAWGFRAKDWAYLMEPLFTPVYARLATRMGINSGTRVLDVGCGSGSGLRHFHEAGADVSGVDAARALLAIASERVGDADLRHASMSELPWPDASFDAVTGVNSFVYGDDGGLTEAHRVLRPDGLLGIGYWLDPGDFAPAMQDLGAALATHVTSEERYTPLRMSDEGSAIRMLQAVGFEVRDSGAVSAMGEFADADIAYRALASTGMIYPVVQAGEEDALRERCVERLRSEDNIGTGIRMSATFGWLVARRAR